MRIFAIFITRLMLLALPLLTVKSVRAEEAAPLGFRVKTEVIHRQLDPGFCWFHPRAAAIPGHGQQGQPAVIVTIQKHLAADDHYSGLWYLRSDDLGKTWAGPTEIAELAWQQESPDVTIAVADVTPAWHAASGKLLAIGTKVRYSQSGKQLDEQPKSNECAYASFDPVANQWSNWKMLEMPDTQSKFYLVCPGCVQWVTKADGTLLLPVYYRGPTGSDYSTTILHCRFDGQTLAYMEHGDELAIVGGRGFAEPSLIEYAGKYFLTLRNDAKGYVTTSDDGLHFSPVRPWMFDDDKELGSYNTQAHWLAHSEGLFLSYTRRGADNDHITRNRAPLFLAQVDPGTLRVMRRTEQALIPERGVMLGNFGAAPISDQESWVTDAEFLVAGKPHPRGADGSTFAARVIWQRPNRRMPRE
ncbi:MAG: sialidase family protein [Pirellulales bacterium]